MDQIISPSNITFAIGLVGILFTIYKSIFDPQAEFNKTDALIQQQMKWFTESTESRFKTMQDSFNALLLQSNNHIHTVDTKVDKLKESIDTMGREITKLGTIIEERVPKK